MKAIRKIVNSNKGMISFCLVLFFLTAGFAKSFATGLPFKVKKATTTTFVKHVVNQVKEQGSRLSFLDQLKDSDADDFEFAFFGNYTVPNSLPVVDTKQKFAEFASYNNIYSNSLYDLYCNWKFHLS